MRQTKTFDLAVKSADGALGQLEAIVSVYGNVDRGNDRCVRGCFADSLARWRTKGRPLPFLWAHKWDVPPLGGVVEAEELTEGLWVKVQLDMQDQLARDVHRKLTDGTLGEFSFGYDLVDWKMVGGVRELRALDLLEVSAVLVGMNPATRLVQAKAGARNAASDLARLEEIGSLAQRIADLVVELTDAPADPDPEPKGRKLTDLQREIAGLMSESGNGRAEEIRRELAAIR
jgi:HK97 family phage prohead protease